MDNERKIVQEEEKKNSICRVCLSYDSCRYDKGLSLFEKYNDVYVFEKIYYIASIEIKKGDDLPDRICTSCHLALENACSFKQKCESSNTFLHSPIELNEPFDKEFLDVSIKEENEPDYENDYLDESLLVPSKTKPSIEVNLNCSETQPRNATYVRNLQLECHDCGESFKSKCKLRVHWKRTHLPKQLTCPYCRKLLRCYKSFHNHVKNRNKSCMNASKVRVEGEGHSRVYHCKDCNAHSKRIQTIMTHLSVHTGARPYKCNLCDKTFTQHSSLACHKEAAHQIYNKEGTCDHCGKYFKGRVKLQNHMKIHSTAQYPCKVCTTVLKTKNSLTQHMKRHSGVRAYTCEVCAKTFYTASELCNHKSQMHLEKKIHTCEICGYKSTVSGTMKKHRKMHSVHNVGCEVCGRFLENQQQLLMHKKRHFEKNFECAYCDKMYYNRKSLSAHFRKKHKMLQITAGCCKAKVLKVELETGSPSA